MVPTKTALRGFCLRRGVRKNAVLRGVNSYVGQIHEFALYIASLKFPYNLKKILLCPSVPHVVQIKAPSSVLPHEGGRRDWGVV